MKENPKRIYLISDSTGELGARFTNALASQFPKARIAIERFNFVDSTKKISKIISGLSPQDSILFHTVLSKRLKQAIGAISRARGIHAFDLTGPPTDFMVKHLRSRPVWDVTAVHRINQDYHQRIDAIEFTMAHDDGMGPAGLDRAEIILVGPSRCSKTPTSVYLAIKGWRVANVPLIRGLGISQPLAALRKDPRVVGFIIRPEKLREVREKRAAELGTQPAGYTDLEEIYKEIKWAGEIYRRYEWRRIDITDRAIEETAAQILRVLPER
ncbi:MAG: kinase/pyrophosphorylase [Candidatus Omnitrophica bacterium]|nr:kinase/pyrophosphorylase [Candidatus Omnitrophota bacterium]